MRFEFATAQRIVFGAGTRHEAGSAAAAFGNRALVVTGAVSERASWLVQALEARAVRSELWSIRAEPTTDDARRAAQHARQAGCQLVVAFGGGSVIDLGKAVAALLTNEGDPLDYLEVVGKGQPIAHPPAPLLAIPTTAGTGSEVTRNAVLISVEHRVKASMRSPLMLPKLAIVDPELTYSMPAAVTAATGLDALTQLIEPFVSSRANPLTDGLCREGMMRAARSLRRACANGQDAAAREDLCVASVLGGLALANAGLGAAHGFAAVLGGLFASAPHGALCARLLAPVLSANVAALRERQPQSSALQRLDEVAGILTARKDGRADDAVHCVSELCEALGVPRLAHYGMTRQHIELVVHQASAASSMKANPIVLTDAELGEVLRQAL